MPPRTTVGVDAGKRPTIGQLREQVDLMRFSKTNDGQGGFTEAWTVVDKTFWAAVINLSSGERIRAMQQENRRAYEVWVRYAVGTDVDANDRLLWKRNQKVLRITGVQYVDDRNRFLKITAEELAAETT